MAMELVTIEQNGERFTIEVPEGTPDADIQQFITAQQGPTGGDVTASPLEVNKNVAAYGVQSATPYLIGGPEPVASPALQATRQGLASTGQVPMYNPVKQVMQSGAIPYAVQDFANVGKTVAKNLTLNSALDLIKKEGLTGAGAEFLRAVLHPFSNQTMVGAAKNLGGKLAQGVIAPENLMTLPYNMAAYEQEKIRANPNAPGLQSNPYAQTVRGEIGSQAPSTFVARQPIGTQAMAGAANQMRAVANMPYGNVSPQERAMLEEDRMMKLAIRRKAFEKVMGPIAPGNLQ